MADQFAANATQRKMLRRHADLVVTACRPWTTDEQYALLRRYLSSRHPGGGMAEMDEQDYADMVEQTPVRTYVIEYREPSVDGKPGKLVGACLSDQQGDGLSMIYSFYDVGEAPAKASAPTLSSTISSAPRAPACPMSISAIGSRARMRMAYKTSFRPMERLGRDGWRRMDAPEPEAVPLDLALPTRSPRRILVDA